MSQVGIHPEMEVVIQLKHTSKLKPSCKYSCKVLIVKTVESNMVRNKSHTDIAKTTKN